MGVTMINYTTHTALSTSNGCVELRKYFDGTWSAYFKDKYGNVVEHKCTKYASALGAYEKLKFEML